MPFHNWTTLTDEFKRFNKVRKKEISLDEAYLMEYEHITQHRFRNDEAKNGRIVRMLCEYEWEKQNRPYYNVHRNIAKSLTKTNLDKIPIEFIETPNNHFSVLFRFDFDCETRYINDGMYFGIDNRIKENPIFCRSVLFSIIPANHVFLIGDHEYSIGNEHVVYNIIVDNGFRTNIDGFERTMCNRLSLDENRGKTIPEIIDSIKSSQKEDQTKLLITSMEQSFVDIFKVIVSCGFLSNSPEENLVVPDIISSDKEKYRSAVLENNQSKIESLIKKSRSRGKNGYNIGTNEMFVVDHIHCQNSSSTGNGRELEYSHIRSGHPHAVRYGRGKEKVKIKWFRSVQVRPDLPFKINE